MVVQIEFYGIPRVRTGVAQTEVELVAASTTLAQIVTALSERFPNFGADCAIDGNLSRSCVANIHGERFVRDARTQIHDGETLLIMSADAGG